ncbi:MAG: hypothetical protein NTZ78_04030 [Candidatus Aureabacteria bacterium]|nr:hypothetical protein [Candidatus Auribacterota bacterium]
MQSGIDVAFFALDPGYSLPLGMRVGQAQRAWFLRWEYIIHCHCGKKRKES